MPGIKVIDIKPCEQIVTDLAVKIEENAKLLNPNLFKDDPIFNHEVFEKNARRYLQWAIAFPGEFLAAIEYALKDDH